eukprot:scaffold10045_cov114-Isochrysis_galbana.AAC.3
MEALHSAPPCAHIDRQSVMRRPMDYHMASRVNRGTEQRGRGVTTGQRERRGRAKMTLAAPAQTAVGRRPCDCRTHTMKRCRPSSILSVWHTFLHHPLMMLPPRPLGQYACTARACVMPRTHEQADIATAEV